jgi:hypothetical protein
MDRDRSDPQEMMNSPYQVDVGAPDEDEPARAVPTTQDQMRERIADLERRIEELTRSIEGCRKIILASKGLTGAGAILIVAIVLGAIRPDPLALMTGIAAVLGGVVLFGSNDSTAKQKIAALRTAEAERADLIGRIDLMLVGEGDGMNRLLAN